ncbi:MAG: hypothetical protein ACM36C_16655 [Acidobacteriota bacterium]
MLARIHHEVVRHCTAGFLGLVTVVAIVAAGCTKPVDLARNVHVMDVTTGWFDAGIVEGGKNKLVPSISFTLHNASSRNLTLQMNVQFIILPQKENQDEVFLQAIDVPAGGSSKPVVVRAKYGFTGEQPRAEMLQHRLFQDFSVRLFAKQGSGQWTLLGEQPVNRQLITK